MEEKKGKFDYYISPIIEKELDKAIIAVTKKDRDFVMVLDGEEGSGKSVLAQQIAGKLDPKFNIDNIVFNSDQFIKRLKTAPKYSCIVLDEAFSSANSRSALTEVNKSLISVATEMRQRNLYVIIVIPSFFDLDKYFALWRCRALFHVYFDKKGARGSYIIFPKGAKKMLFLLGKKFYSYSKPASPYPVCRFTNHYVVDEQEYRKKKEEAFRKRTVSNIARRWKAQRDGLVNEMYHNLKVPSAKFEKVFTNWGARPISQREIQRIVMNYGEENRETEFEDEIVEENNVKKD